MIEARCSCGATFKVDYGRGYYTLREQASHAMFLEAHKACRENRLNKDAIPTVTRPPFAGGCTCRDGVPQTTSGCPVHGVSL